MHHNTNLQRAYDTHGQCAFTFSVIAQVKAQYGDVHISDVEQTLIDDLRDKAYNIGRARQRSKVRVPRKQRGKSGPRPKPTPLLPWSNYIK